MSIVQCPSCGTRLKRPALAPGQLVRCPRCAKNFPLEEEEERAEDSLPEVLPVLPKKTEPREAASRRRPSPRRDEAEEEDSSPERLPGCKTAMILTALLLIMTGVDLVYSGFECRILFYVVSSHGIPNMGQTLFVEFTMQSLHIVLFLGTAVVFSIWFYRVYANLTLLGVSWLENTPGGAVGDLFIPLLNLYRPALDAQEIWKASNPSAGSEDWRSGNGSILIGLWWFCWAVGWFVRLFSSRLLHPLLGRVTAGEALVGVGLGLLGNLLFLGADIFLFLVVRAIMRRQQRKLHSASTAGPVGGSATSNFLSGSV